MSTKLTVETCDGHKEEFVMYKDMTFPKPMVDARIKRDIADHINDVIHFDVNESDVFLATYMKAGTHWAWEVINMLRNGSAEYIKSDKEAFFFDMVDAKAIAKRSSPRVLNSHFTPRCIPKEIVEKGIKIVQVYRNPKDVLVSAYHHILKMQKSPFNESFDTFFKFFIGCYGVHMFCSWIHYVKEWESFAKDHPGQILCLFYEDMKEDSVRETRKINEFLGCNCSDDVVGEIADACSFDNMKKADVNKQHSIKPATDMMFRKGEVGDWKNWLTVAQNEQMDQWLKEAFTGTDLRFRYTL